jgi:hypothetical protein
MGSRDNTNFYFNNNTENMHYMYLGNDKINEHSNSTFGELSGL